MRIPPDDKQKGRFLPSSESRHRSLRAAFVLVAGHLALVAAAGAVRLEQVRVWGYDDHFRVVLDLSGPVVHSERVLTDPDRIAIDIRDATAADLVLPATGDWMVRRLRFNQLSGPTAQIVLDLDRPPAYSLFTLPADDGRPFRIVCDVTRPRDRSQAPPIQRDWIVVVDPGHGGRDPGVVNQTAGLEEKEIVLDVAQRLKRLLDAQEGVSVRLTRSRDEALRLDERVRRAQEAEGDVFLSIHVNGFRSAAARGAEVFFLSLSGATDAAAREVAELENAAGLDEEPVYGEIAKLPFGVDLIQTDTIERSSRLAEVLLEVLDDSGLTAARGVKQANFVVLRSCRLPSALIELGFISNPADARRLASADHRQALAETVARGLLAFRERYARSPEGAEQG